MIDAVTQRIDALAEQGELAAAVSLCHDRLSDNGDDGPAWFLLGRIETQADNLYEALIALEQAARLMPENIEVHMARAAAAQVVGENELALICYDQAIGINANNSDAWFERGNALTRLLRLAEAIGSFDRAIELNPRDAEIFFARGWACHRFDRAADALNTLNRAIALDPEHAKALHLRGNVLTGLGRHEEALESLTAALQISPGEADALNDLGCVLRKLDRVEEAGEAFGDALRADPNSTAALLNWGYMLHEQNRYLEALACFDRVLAINPRVTVAHIGRSAALRLLNRCPESLAAAEIALALDPARPEALLARGNTLCGLNRNQEAFECYQQAVALPPPNSYTFSSGGAALLSLGRTEEALSWMQHAVDLDPAIPAFRYNRSFCLLKLGRLRQGWDDYEERLNDPFTMVHTSNFNNARWTGAENLNGKTILLRAEQGLGDTLQFCRYAPLVAARGARVVLEVQPPLVRLLSRMPGLTEVAPTGESRTAADYHCPLLSLPKVFATTLETIPGQTYLTADAAAVEVWRQRLVARLPGNRRVGLVWAGSARDHSAELIALDQRRSAPLSVFAPLADIPGIALVSLQKGGPAEQLRSAPAGFKIYDPTHLLNDFADTAALIEALDLVISVDTSVVHLAGGMGKPIWVLNRLDACWRWLEGRTDSPWYPSARLFHQPVAGDWQSVVAEVAEALRSL